MAEPKVDVVLPGGVPTGFEAQFDKADYDAIRDKMGLKVVDLEDIKEEMRVRVIDPFVNMVVDDEILAIGQEAKKSSKHRYTIIVPSEEEGAVLNIGHLNTKEKLTNPGISARTKSHIQLHTNGGMKSMLAMGVKVEGGGDGLPEDPKTALTKNSGIAVVTDGNTWIDAKLQLNMVSREREAHLRSSTKYVRVQADAGNVEAAAGVNVTVGAKENIQIFAGSATKFGDHAYAATLDDSFSAEVAGVCGEVDIEASDYIQTVIGVFQGLVGYASEVGDMSWFARVVEVPKMLLDVADGYFQYKRLSAEGVKGQVKIVAEKGAGMSGESASIYGTLSAGVGSALSATVIGTSAALKGLAAASVWAGMGVSIRTVAREVSIGSDLGDVTMAAGKETAVNLKRRAGECQVGGKKLALLTSPLNVQVTGGEQAFMSAGDGDGMGVYAKPGFVWVGTLANAGKKDARPDGDYSIVVSKKATHVKLRATDETTINMAPGGIEVNAKSFKFNGMNEVYVGSKRVLLGD